ncbi:hypothetical protein, partial [Bacteroides stercoris]|uniref:hypothetical protein n=1 Tax=Bacteroides stercoris TaxID=46506 RepID=UPI00321AC3D1
GHYTYPMVAQFSTGILAHFSISIYTPQYQTLTLFIQILPFFCEFLLYLSDRFSPHGILKAHPAPITDY